MMENISAYSNDLAQLNISSLSSNSISTLGPYLNLVFGLYIYGGISNSDIYTHLDLSLQLDGWVL